MWQAESSSKSRGNDFISLSAILTALQQGVIAINNVTMTLKTTFPSS